MRPFRARNTLVAGALVWALMWAGCAPPPEESAEAAEASSIAAALPSDAVDHPVDEAGDTAVAPRPAAEEASPAGGHRSSPSSADEQGGPSAGSDEGPTRYPGLDEVDRSTFEPQTMPAVDFENARFPRPEHVRGLYLNAWTAGSSRRVDELLALARETEINTFVIDIKDATGYVSHDTKVPLAKEVGADGERRIRDLPGLLDRLQAEGIYPIARLVVIKDPLLSVGRPDLAIQDTAGGVWIDSKDLIWLNPFNHGVWDYHVQLAREVAEMGFPEIQWDYIRFPDAPESDMARAVFPGSEGLERVDAIRGFLSYARDELSDLPVRITADVFGVTTSFRRDVGIGQLWETFIDVVDVALPMVYPSHYWEGSFGYGDPNAYPYEVVRAALRDARRRSAAVDGAGLTRPWLQDFSLGQPHYGAAEVRAQIQAAYDVGVQEWVLWNPSSRYSTAALEPNGGFEAEPWVRVAGVLTPVSRRQIVIDSVASLPVVPGSPDGTRAEEDAPAVSELEGAASGVGGPEGDSTGLDAFESEGVPTDTAVSVIDSIEAPADRPSLPTDSVAPEDTVGARSAPRPEGRGRR